MKQIRQVRRFLMAGVCGLVVLGLASSLAASAQDDFSAPGAAERLAKDLNGVRLFEGRVISVGGEVEDGRHNAMAR